jgi:hyperosmotically inducible protein
VVRQSESHPHRREPALTNNDREPPAATTKDKVTEGTKQAAHKAEKAATEAGEMITDGWITSKVKTQLMAADGVHASAINVDTTDHVVTLRGHVRSEAERRKAVKLARETRGVGPGARSADHRHRPGALTRAPLSHRAIRGRRDRAGGPP